MWFVLVLISGLLASTSALAQPRGLTTTGVPEAQPPQFRQQQQQMQAQQQRQFQAQGQQQQAIGIGGAGGAGGNAVVNNTLGGGGFGRRNRYPASSAFAPSGGFGGLNSCGASFGAGVQTFGFGFSLGIPIEQTQCTYRANAITVAEITGNRTAGMLVLAQEPGMRSALAGAGLIIEPVWNGQAWAYPQQVAYVRRTGVRRHRRACNC